MRAAALFGIVLAGCPAENSTCIENLGIDISNVVVDAYNMAVRGSSGSGSWSFTCNKGGDAQITGTVNSLTVTYDLSFMFRSCAHDQLILDGAMTDRTSNGNVSSKIKHATSPALTIRGTASGCRADYIDATCDVDILYDGGWTTTICGVSN